MALAEADVSACEALLNRLRDEGRLPGIVAAVFTPAGPAWEGRSGSTSAQYRIGSLTKTFTAVAVLQLRELGRLDLGDTIADHVPDSPYPRSTLRELLSHSAGMTAEPLGPWWERSPGKEWRHLAQDNRVGVTVFRPSQRYHYSNVGFAMLGELVSRHRSTTWYDALRLHILEPLALNSTTYHPGEGAAQGTSRDPITGQLMKEPAYDSLAMAAAGQLWSSPADLARWGAFLISGDNDVLPRQALIEMRTAQSADSDIQHLGAYGLGLRLRWRSQSTLVGHTGSMPGFLAGTFADSVSGVGAVVLTNATTGLAPEKVVADLVDLVEPALATVEAAPDTAAPPGTKISTPASPAAELAGNWYFGNTPLEVRPDAAGFALVSGDGSPAFRHLEGDVYLGLSGYYAGERLTVVRRPDGAVSHLEVVTFVLTRTPYDPSAPIPGALPAEALSWPG